MKVFLTGKPGVGKTTLLIKAIDPFLDKIGGFYTYEIRKGGERVGFVVKALNGPERLMAHVDFKDVPKVGKYGVSIKAFEEVALVALKKALEEKEILLIDEIGKMELLSFSFKELVLEALKSPKHLLGTIPIKGPPFLKRIREDKGVQIVEVTPSNRGDVLAWLRKRLEEILR